MVTTTKNPRAFVVESKNCIKCGAPNNFAALTSDPEQFYCTECFFKRSPQPGDRIVVVNQDDHDWGRTVIVDSIHKGGIIALSGKEYRSFKLSDIALAAPL